MEWVNVRALRGADFGSDDIPARAKIQAKLTTKTQKATQDG